MDVLATLSQFCLSALLGAMVFFAAVVTPTTFKALGENETRRFLRTLFPRFYVFGAVLATLASIFAMGNSLMTAGIIITIAFGFVWSRQSLMPKINAARDAQTAGHEGAEARFKRLHSLSVRIFLIQALVIIGLLSGIADA